MKKKKHPAKLTISRLRGDKECVSISIEDTDAVLTFVRLELDLEQFAEALMGLASVQGEMEVMGLENVGKKREMKTLEFPLPDDCGHYYAKTAEEEVGKYLPEGWEFHGSFESKSSFFDKNGKKWARCRILRWIDKNES